MSDYALFVCTDGGYLAFANALLNSMQERGLHVDTYLLHYDVECPEYLEAVKTAFDFNVIPVEIDTAALPSDHACGRPVGRNLSIKQSRFRYIAEHAGPYRAVCLMDADMFVVSDRFGTLLDLVSGTRRLIGCNERFKWTFGPRYCCDGEPLFNQEVRALKFHCSVPIICDLAAWRDVLDEYNRLAYHCYEDTNPGSKPVGDMYCWNIAVYRCGRQDDVVTFPMQLMTQVHHTTSRPFTTISKGWLTEDGDEVYSIHGRMGSSGWLAGELKHIDRNLDGLGITDSGKRAKLAAKSRASLAMIEREWYRLAFGSRLRLQDFLPMPKHCAERMADDFTA